MKRFKKILISGITLSLLLGSTLSVNAANVRDLFDAEYYAEKYDDLAAAFGNDEKALYRHYITFGIVTAIRIWRHFTEMTGQLM